MTRFKIKVTAKTSDFGYEAEVVLKDLESA